MVNNRPTLMQRNPWFIWGIGTLFACLQFLLQSSIAVLGQGISQDLQLSSVALGWYASIYFFAYISLQIPVGKLLDKFGARKILLISIPLTMIFCIMSALSHNIFLSYLFRFLLGAVNAPAVVTAIYLANQWFPKKKYGMIVGLTELICLGGAGFGLKILSLITQYYHWHLALFGCALLCALIWVFIYHFVFDNPKYQLKPRNKENKSSPSFRVIFATPGLLATGLFAGFSGAFLASFAGLWGVQFLETKYNIDLITATNGPQLILLGAGISSFLLGAISDKLGRRKPVMIIATLLTTLFLLLVLYSPLNLTLIFIALFLMGLSAGSYMLCFSIAKELLPIEQQGLGIGFINLMTMIIGALILQPFIGWLLEKISSHHQSPLTLIDFKAALAIIPILLILALVSLTFIKERTNHQH